MKRVLVFLLVVLLVGVVAACPPPPEKPECEEGQVTVEESEWVNATYKTVQVCQKVWKCVYRWHGICFHWKQVEVCHDKRVVDVPAHWTDPVCDVPEVPKEGCAFTQYILQGNYPCYLQRNLALGDKKSELPARYDGTDYMQKLCNQCNGRNFKWDGNFITTCKEFVPCGDCE